MKQIHAHEVLFMMMEGGLYTDASLKEAIIKRFGPDARFYTCSAENMDADQLIAFLKQKGKFKSDSPKDGFTVDSSKMCKH